MRSRRTANDAVIHDDYPFAFDELRQGVKLPLYAEIAEPLIGLNECASDIPVQLQMNKLALEV